MGRTRYNAKDAVSTGTGKLIALCNGDTDRPCRQREYASSSSSSSHSHREGGSYGGMNPSDLYARYSWKVENPTQMFEQQVHSPIFNVCGTHWIIMTCLDPEIQECVSLYLCVAFPDRLLPGWGQYAQFTVSAINKDSTKSVHCDAFHRFTAKEYDYGWAEVLFLSNLVEDPIWKNSIEFQIQLQLMREKPHIHSSCLIQSYRRDLFREMGPCIEHACFEFVKKQTSRVANLARNQGLRKFSFGPFYLSLKEGSRQKLLKERTGIICTNLLESLLEGETIKIAILVEMLHLGIKVLEKSGDHTSRSIGSSSADASPSAGRLVFIKNGMFVLAEHIFQDAKNVFQDSHAWDHEQILQLMDRESVEDLSDSYPDQEDSLFAELGRQTIEIYVIAHIFCEKIYPEYLLQSSLRKQEELLQELDAEKEKQSSKHSKSKAKRKAKKGKEKSRTAESTTHEQPDGPKSEEGEDVSGRLMEATLENSSDLVEEPTVPNVKTENSVDCIEQHMDDLSLDQSDTSWIRKERKKSRGRQGHVEKSGDSKPKSDHQKLEKDYSIKDEFIHHPVSSKRRTSKQHAAAKDHEREKTERVGTSKAPLIKAERTGFVDLSQKSWEDFKLDNTFGPVSHEDPSSRPSEEFPFMNLLNYIMDDELEWTHISSDTSREKFTGSEAIPVTEPAAFDSYFSVSVNDAIHGYK